MKSVSVAVEMGCFIYYIAVQFQWQQVVREKKILLVLADQKNQLQVSQ